MSRIGQKIIDRFERFTSDLEKGVDVAQTYTCRQIVLDLNPTEFTAERVLQSRKALGLSQVLFAKFIGVSPKTVRAWEQGTNTPQDIACRLMDEILHNPEYWRGRVIQMARTKIPTTP